MVEVVHLRLCSSSILAVVNVGVAPIRFNFGDNPTSPKTEIVAMVIALLWSVQLGDCHPHHLAKFDMFIGYDCLMAGHTAAGQWEDKGTCEPPNTWQRACLVD